MPIQVYECPDHGTFEIQQSIKLEVLPLWGCLKGLCTRAAVWCPPRGISFTIDDGGTGAGKESHHPR